MNNRVELTDLIMKNKKKKLFLTIYVGYIYFLVILVISLQDLKR